MVEGTKRQKRIITAARRAGYWTLDLREIAQFTGNAHAHEPRHAAVRIL